MNSGLLAAFKYAEDQFVRLTWEDEQIFPHEHAQNNIENLAASIEALSEGDIATPFDEYLYGSIITGTHMTSIKKYSITSQITY